MQKDMQKYYCATIKNDFTSIPKTQAISSLSQLAIWLKFGERVKVLFKAQDLRPTR